MSDFNNTFHSHNILLYNIFNYIFFSRNFNLKNSIIFDSLFSIWNLGSDGEKLEFLKTMQTKEKGIIKITNDLFEKFPEESIGILMYDIQELCNYLEENPDHLTFDENFKKIKRRIRRKKNLIPFKNTNIDKIYFQSSSHSIGYLFVMTLLIDGMIKRVEYEALKQDLEKWTSLNARQIMYYFDFYMKLYVFPTILSTFNDEFFLGENEKNNIINCLVYLKDHESKFKRKIVLEQTIKIIKADNFIHENEKWISDKMHEIWNDIE